MVYHPLELDHQAACARYSAGPTLAHPPPAKGWPVKANHDDVASTATATATTTTTTTTSMIINAGPLEATLKNDYNLHTTAFVVLGLDHDGNPFALPSQNYALHRDRIALTTAPWHAQGPWLDREPVRVQVQSHNANANPLLQKPNAIGGYPPASPACCTCTDQPAVDDELRSDDWVDDATDSDESRPASTGIAAPSSCRSSRKAKPKLKPRFPPKGEVARSRKRPRSSSRNQSLQEEEDDDPEEWPASIDAALEEQTTDKFRIDNRDRVIQIFALRLDQMQQLACKVILKAWIKNIEPKKQSKFPYVGSSKDKDGNKRNKRSKCVEGSDTPPWWPTRKEDWWSLLPKCGSLDQVRHKEPDHLKKEERLILGVHLLLTQAEKNPGINGDCGIRGLIKSTKDCSLQFDQDTSNGTDRKTKRHRFLNEIYDLAEKWSDYRQGGLDPDSLVFVKIYPKQALATKRRRQASGPKRNAQESSVENVTRQQNAPENEDINQELIMSTNKLELDEASAWGYPQRDAHGMPEAQQVSGFYLDQENGMRVAQLRSYEYPNELQSPYGQPQQMIPSPMYAEMPTISPRYSYDAKSGQADTPYMDGSDYSLSRDPSGHVNQQQDYRGWPPMTAPQAYSPSSTVSLSHASTSHTYDHNAATQWRAPSATCPKPRTTKLDANVAGD
ncbi:hypothetical protein K490DRAFT_57413 [Saccharata proteae CBS 121410]|uniref:Subtelomeric hrmA-associated cluster protein AFUB-079030/YDR124W-like helical bundle domain-containing protein n=1 Tax=Saccharata proteae CBS 121410 TaxID=1314787 RepID=A0A9P4HWL6_9PEZI|nr:hypothetical protein K490DRAFT_57413 [Saccharata proteae CBS 121410]